MKPGQVLRAWSDRILRGVMGAALAGLFAAVLDTAWARGQGDDTSFEVKSFSLFLADAGLLSPIALLVGAAVGVGSVAVFPERAPSPSSLKDWLRDTAKGRPADVAAFVPLMVLASFFWTTMSAQLARALLALEIAAPLVGFAIATGSMVIGLLSVLFALAITPALRQALAHASDDGRKGFVDPVRTGLGALFVVAILFAIGVKTGSVSGEGGPLGIYGIFKRPELDLRAPGLLALMALCSVVFAAASSFRQTLFFVLVALAPLSLLGRAAVSLNGDGASLAQVIERGAPLGKMSLGVLRKLSDRDHDGASGWFGGGDCREGDARVGPLGTEVPDNGIDEDCSGSDLRLAALGNLGQDKPVDVAVKTAIRDVVPKDLNIVLITIDTLRADLGYAGYAQPVSPNLDALAARSTVFLNAYSLASYTGKSIGPMLIGKYGSETQRNWGHFNKFSDEETFVAQRISKAGIRTMGVHAHRYFGKFGGLDRGFDVVDLSAAPPESAAWDVADQSSSAALSDAAIKLLEKPENTSGRFFLWIHYLDPHADYLAHDDVPKFGSGQRAQYDGEIAFTDKHIGRVLDAVKKAPYGSKTAIIVTSDHGEAFGEHKMFRHGFELWEPLVRVPLIVHVPEAKPSRVDVRRSLIDLVPTMLELLHIDLPKPVEGSADRLSGTSLLPDVFLEANAKPEARDVLIDMPAGPYNDARRSFIHGDLKFTISNNTAFELYDLAKDPGETKNLWTSPDTRGDMADRYAAAKTRLHEIRVTGPRK
ncbi:MAG TPA: sulfatase-like hydrolase/transferase [Polyangium sp.]|nr:sulfatase-like hydrolase/transferase [Polyangium sp.]